MKNLAKVIFHIDLNQFFCSVAMIKNPRLKGKAFAIGRENTTKGVISTASYEARRYGIHSGMSLVEAFQKLPTLIVVNYGYELYSKYSQAFFALLKEYVTNIEQTSIDEGYLDVTDITIKINRHPLDLAQEIQSRALKELNLPCSIGIAPTLFLAKMASDLKKPLGITVLRIRDVEKVLYPLPVKDIFGIGKKTYPLLEHAGIKTIGDFANPQNRDIVVNVIGEHNYLHVINQLNGKSTNVVDPYRYSEPESISRSTTYDSPLRNSEEILNEIIKMGDEVHHELIMSKKLVKTVGIVLRDTQFKTITRSKTLNEATTDKTIINYYVEELVDLNYDGSPLRLVGISYSNLVDAAIPNVEEITLFNYEDYYGKTEAINKLIAQFGNDNLFFGKDLNDKKAKKAD